VSAAPLVVAAVCSDGIALVALSSGNNTNDSALQNREVLRIHQVDGDGTALLCAGWRTDAEWLANKCRSLVAQHVATFGTFGGDVSNYLPQDMSLWMASCASSSSSARPLSVVGLLACAHDKTLSLVDATGHYHVRAHAVGRGARRVNDEILRRVDFSQMTAQEGVDYILEELVKLSTPKATEDEKESETKEKQQTDPTWTALSNETTQVEVAFVNAKTKQLQRLPATTRLPFAAVRSSTTLS
jgi:hypothetical protein